MQLISGSRNQKERDTGEERLVGGVVGRLEFVSLGAGPSDLFDPCTFRLVTCLSFESRKV